MLVFDLPDYSKSSTAQNEKLVPGGAAAAAGGHPCRFPAKPNSSPLASCFQEIWCGSDVSGRGDTIRTVANMAAGGVGGGKTWPVIMRSSFIPPTFWIQPSMYVEADQMFQ